MRPNKCNVVSEGQIACHDEHQGCNITAQTACGPWQLQATINAKLNYLLCSMRCQRSSNSTKEIYVDRRVTHTKKTELKYLTAYKIYWLMQDLSLTKFLLKSEWQHVTTRSATDRLHRAHYSGSITDTAHVNFVLKLCLEKVPLPGKCREIIDCCSSAINSATCNAVKHADDAAVDGYMFQMTSTDSSIPHLTIECISTCRHQFARQAPVDGRWKIP